MCCQRGTEGCRQFAELICDGLGLGQVYLMVIVLISRVLSTALLFPPIAGAKEAPVERCGKCLCLPKSAIEAQDFQRRILNAFALEIPV